MPTNPTRFDLRALAPAVPLLLGALAFFLIVGPLVLLPGNIAWLSGGDPAAHYMGWHFFQHSDWFFPVGRNPNYGLELSSAIIYSDSLPLFALPFKLIASVLPFTFQYFGWWLLVCFLLQAWFGWKLAGLITRDAATSVLVAGLFVFAPPMMWRLHGHLSLVGHFLVLAAIYLVFRPGQKYRTVFWIGVLVAASLVHAYLCAMVMLCWIADLSGRLLSKSLAWRTAALEFVATVAAVAFAVWQAGYLTVGDGASKHGYGSYHLNLLSLIDSDGWSYWLPDLANVDREYEGFNYLGLGVIFLLVCCVPVLLGTRTGLSRAIARFPMMLAALVGLSAFAITNSVSVGSFNFTFALPEWLLHVANIFRGSGRFFWPVFYVIVLAIVFLIVRGHRRSVATALLAIALALQIADTSATWLTFRERYSAEPASAWPTRMKGKFWKAVGSRYTEIRRVLPQPAPPHWPTVGAFAVKHGMGTDLVHLARVNEAALIRTRNEARTAIETGEYDPKALYVIDEQWQTIAAYSLDSERDLLARIDDLIVVAPGWKACAACPQPQGEITLEDLLPRLPLGERASFTGSSPALRYPVAGGWQEPSEWGVWSSGARAEMVVPIDREASHISIVARAYVASTHEEQRILMTVNNIPIEAVTLRNRYENTIDIPLPEAVRQDVLKRGAVHVEFEFPDAITPMALGISEDGRTYALG